MYFFQRLSVCFSFRTTGPGVEGLGAKGPDRAAEMKRRSLPRSLQGPQNGIKKLFFLAQFLFLLVCIMDLYFNSPWFYHHVDNMGKSHYQNNTNMKNEKHSDFYIRCDNGSKNLSFGAGTIHALLTCSPARKKRSPTGKINKKMWFCIILLLRSGDVERNPGPVNPGAAKQVEETPTSTTNVSASLGPMGSSHAMIPPGLPSSHSSMASRCTMDHQSPPQTTADPVHTLPPADHQNRTAGADPATDPGTLAAYKGLSVGYTDQTKGFMIFS